MCGLAADAVDAFCHCDFRGKRVGAGQKHIQRAKHEATNLSLKVCFTK